MNELETRLRDAFAARAALVTPESLRAGRPPARRRRIGRWAVPAVAGLAVAATVVGVLVAGGRWRNHAEPPTRPHPSPTVTSLTGAELRRSLGTVVARQGSGHLDVTSGDTSGPISVDFVLRDNDVDFVAEFQDDRIVAKNGVVVSSRTPPMNLAHLPANLELEGIVPAFAQSMRLSTFQQQALQKDEELPAATVFSGVGPTDDGSTVWTGSWTANETRYDVRLVVDAAGLPVEYRSTVTWPPNPDYTEAPSVRVIRYSRWGQTVQVPEPTPFGAPEPGPSTVPTSPGFSPSPSPPGPSPSPSPSR